MDLQAMMLVPVFYMAPLPETSSCPETYHETATCEPSCSDSTSSWDDDLYAMLKAIYEDNSKWQFIEEGLWLRANPLPLFDQCYVEEDNGDYRIFGANGDFSRLAEELAADYKGVAVVNAETTDVRVYIPKQDALVLSLKPGLRYLRCYPDLLGVMMQGDSTRLFSHIEANWREEKRPVKERVLTQLVMALLRAKDRGHLCFW